MPPSTSKHRALILSALTVLSVMVGSVAFVGSTAALQGLTAGSTADVAIGQQSVNQQTTFDADLADAETVTVTIDTGQLRAAGGSVSSVSASSSNGNITVSSSGVDGSGNMTVTLADGSAGGFDPAVTTVTVTATLDTDGVLQTSTGISYTIIDGNGGVSSVTQTFDLTPLTVSGTTFRADGTTPLDTVTVEVVETGTSTTSDGSGAYTLNISDLSQLSDETAVDIRASKSGNKTVTNAANVSTGDVTGFDFTLQAVTASGLDSLYWQGQMDTLTGLETEEEYTIERVEARSQSGFVSSTTLIRQRSTDASGNFSLDTSGLNTSEYVILGPGLADADGTAPDPPLFEVVEQDLTTTFEEDSVANRGSSTNVETSYTVESNRGEFNATLVATIDGNTVDAADLNDTLPSAIVTGVDSSDDEVNISVTGGATYTLNFSGQTAGEWNLTLVVVDTDSVDNDTIDVQDVGAGQASFAQGTTEVAQGDVASIELELSEAAIGGSGELVIGNYDSDGYQANVTFTDGDADGTVTVLFNTYAAGNTSAGASTIVSVEDPDDSIDSFNTNNRSSGGDQAQLPSRMLATGDYEIYVSTEANSPDATVDSPDGFATLFIAERSDLSASVWTAPHLATLSDADDINSGLAEGTVTEDDTIATDDYAIVQVTGTGLEGMVEQYGLATAFATNDRLNLTVVQENPDPNREPKELNLSGTGSQLSYVDDVDNDSYYVVIDLNDNVDWEREGADVNLANDDVFNTTVSVEDNRLLRSTSEDDEEEVSAEFEHVDRTLRWTLGLGGTVQVEAASGQMVSGTSSVAAGTEVQLRLQSTGDTEPRFVKTATAVVQEDGTWSAEFDFSGQAVGDTFDSRARIAGLNAVNEDGEVVDEIAATPGGVRTVRPASPTPPVLVVTHEVTREVTRTVQRTVTVTVTQTPGQPGFGIAVAIVALLAAALLAVRRRD